MHKKILSKTSNLEEGLKDFAMSKIQTNKNYFAWTDKQVEE